MALAIWFWLFYVLAFLFGSWRTYADRATPYGYWFGGLGILMFILVGILGYHDFGGPIK